MKNFILLITIVFGTSLCSTKRDVGANVKPEVFMKKPGDKSLSWMELSGRGDSISGVFYGVEKLPDGALVYYKSIMIDLVSDDGHIRFRMSEYLVSKKPFEGEIHNMDDFIKDESIWPIDLRFPQSVSGVMTSDSVRLNIFPQLADSRFNELILVKIK